ncbi:MAG: SusC/RagA family TonB-linked outer membrane protein, partial [Chitinophagaceae bacterium]
MLAKKLSGVTLSVISLFLSLAVAAQTKTITGKVTDSKDGTPVVGASVVAKGSKSGTSTNSEGNFTLSVGSDVSSVTITSVGYGKMEVPVGPDGKVTVTLESINQDLNAVVVVGYGTARKKDLTGAVASIQAKDFNKGPTSNPDQLLQGKVAGLQVINSSGQPGAATIVKIRGSNSIRSGNTPLYVIDGIPLDGRSARPGLNNSGLGNTPDANPLLYINPNDIASIDVLKDASASAIYGSRGANGVILVTTKKGQSGPAKIEVSAVSGVAGVMRKIDVLSANEYRSALTAYNAPKSDSGASIDPFKEITHSAVTQNYSVAFSGGGENGKYRASFLYADQEGIVRKTGLRKYVANFNAQHRFLNNKLSLDFNLTAANTSEKLAPISNDAGSTGNIISLALIWNPTLLLQRANGLYNQVNPSGQTNPLALSEAFNDITNQTVLLTNISAGYKITSDLEYRLLLGLNYETGQRKEELMGWLAGFSGPTGGAANISNSKLFSQTVTHTLNYNKKINENLSLSALAGYEFWKTALEGNTTFASKFNLNQTQFTVLPNYHYYDNIQAGDQANLRSASFKDPSVELQSYFARASLNYQDKYLLTATVRTDGSSKFGKNNKYATFPSIAAAWNITNEDFMKKNTLFDALKLRV